MKKIILTAMAAIGMIAGANAQKIKGSDTVLPLAQKFAETYKGDVTVTGGGTGVGFAALTEGTCDIAMASRKMKFSEKADFTKKGVKIKEATIGLDALAVIVNPSNPVSQLTKEQIEQIYTGAITNWKEVGGPDLKIVVYARETSSGTYEFFKEELMQKKNYKSDVLSMPATGAVIQSVGQTKGAIGYVGLAYLNKEVKPLKISYDGGKTAVAPTFENAKSGKYPVIRPLMFYYRETNKTVAPFVQFVLSPKGQEIVKTIGYIPVTK